MYVLAKTAQEAGKKISNESSHIIADVTPNSERRRHGQDHKIRDLERENSKSKGEGVSHDTGQAYQKSLRSLQSLHPAPVIAGGPQINSEHSHDTQQDLSRLPPRRQPKPCPLWERDGGRRSSRSPRRRLAGNPLLRVTGHLGLLLLSLVYRIGEAAIPGPPEGLPPADAGPGSTMLDDP